MRKKIDVDVLVVGGGASGVSAAIGSARSGSATLLVERDGFIGGLASGAWVGTVCGAARCQVDTWSPILDGWPAHFIELLSTRSHTAPERTREGLWYLPYSISAFRTLATEELKRTGVRTLLHSTVSSIEFSNDTIGAAKIITFDGALDISCRAVIDCSGEAIVSTLAGIPTATSDEYQSPSLVFRVRAKKKPVNEAEWRLALPYHLKDAAETGVLPDVLRSISIVPGSIDENSLLLKLTLPNRRRENVEEVNERSVTELSLMAVDLLGNFGEWLRTAPAPLDSCSIDETAPSLGVRSGRRLVGAQTLMTERVLSGEVDDGDIALGGWPIEEWKGGRTPELTFGPVGAVYGIPAKTLVSLSARNLFAAGRAISSEERALASARVIGTCLQTGWAAGSMASQLVRTGSYNEIVRELNEACRQRAAYAP